MFTGIVTDIGTLKEINDERGDRRFIIETSFDMDEFKIGASICCSGCCLTIVEKGRGWFAVDVSSETISKTCPIDWQVGSQINLEQSLKLGDEMGGHVVSGHVDGVADILSIMKVGDSYRIRVKLPHIYSPYIARKGSICLNGVSLTVNDVDENEFDVNIIPHTWANTTFSTRKVGDKINFEIDMLARYVARILNKETL